ncbi:MAG: DEAD/DEAH box helicase family protein, partial [Gemmatimonadaceae bacterium]|nr:DEAD/DEAH box helicase family protein [Gemmatimonadaceae bacterium]
MSIEVTQPILVSPYEEPDKHWYIQRGETPRQLEGRRASFVFRPRNQTEDWDVSDGTLARMRDYENAYEMVLVMRLRDAVGRWRDDGYPGVTRTTRELLDLWRRRDRQQRLFFAQVEAAETIVFIREARADYLQGIEIPRDEPAAEFRAPDFAAWTRYACKMATGSGKTTVMAMLAAWSILNKVTNRGDGRFSDAVLVICPNITIRDRLRELDPAAGDASLYRTRDLVPPHMMPLLARGRVLVTNWHVFEPLEMGRVGDTSSRVVKKGVIDERNEIIHIGERNTTARGKRYLTLDEFQKQADAQVLFVKSENRDESGKLISAAVYFRRYIESDTALVERVLGRELGKKQNILVLNDEAHHAYRIHPGSDESDEESLSGTAADDEQMIQEATVWISGLDRVHAARRINFAVDLSATPYFLARAGRDTARPFPWTVSDFGLVDAIESGLVKIPQLAATDTTADERAKYFNVWDWVKEKLTATERERGAGPKPEAVLKHAAQPISMLAGDWKQEFERWREREDKRPPVMIIVCKDIRLAKAVHEWIAEGRQPVELPKFEIEELRNADGKINTIRVDTKVVAESDSEGAKSDEVRWMRFTLDTVGKLEWPRDRQGRAIYPTGFEELAEKLGREHHPPGRDIRCIVSVGMLTEGWDATTVTHILGLRPFMSQLLCEQVVGRGLRRASYEVGENGLFSEELAQVFGVPFEIVPFKGKGDRPTPAPKRFHVKALEARAEFEIRFPRVEGYTQAVKSRVTVNWAKMPRLALKPGEYPTLVDVNGFTLDSAGRAVGAIPGTAREMTIDPYFEGMRIQRGVFQMASALTKNYLAQRNTTVSAHMLFPQLEAICRRFVNEYVVVPPKTERVHVFQAPYYTWAVEILLQQIQPDTSAGESVELPRLEALRQEGSTSDVDFWTSKDVRDTKKSHVNYTVRDSGWESEAAGYIDRHASVVAFVKNAGLGFAIPYMHNGEMHDFMPDFIVRVRATNGD